MRVGAISGPASVLFFLCGIGSAHAAGIPAMPAPPAAPGEADFPLSLVELPRPPVAQFAPAPGIALPAPDGRIPLGPDGFRYKVDKFGLQIFVQPGVAKSVTRPGERVSLRWKDGGAERQVSLELRQDKDKNWRAVPVSALAGTVGDVPIRILDWNFNGAYNDESADAVLIGESRCAVPLEKTMYIGKYKVTFNLTPSGVKSKAAVEQMPDSPMMPAILHLNMRRAQAGLPPRPLDAALSAACQAHAHYCVVNNYFGHPEDPKKPGYTKEGHELGGMNAILSNGRSSVGAVDGFLCTFLHRIDLIHPDTDAFGIGSEGTITSINGRTKRRTLGKWEYPVLYPPPEMEGVPLLFSNEMPNPLPPEHGNKPAGFPVTATFQGKVKVTGASGELSSIGQMPPEGSDPESWPKGTPVEAYFSSPEKPTALGNLNSICFIAKQPLRPNTVYIARISYSAEGKGDSRVWWFKTGSVAMPGAHGIGPERRTPKR